MAGFWPACSCRFSICCGWHMRAWLGPIGNYLNFFGIAICLSNLVHILVSECFSFVNSDGLENLEILRILLPFYFPINFDQGFKGDLCEEVRHCLNKGIESVVADVAGGMREHVRQEQVDDILPGLFEVPEMIGSFTWRCWLEYR